MVQPPAADGLLPQVRKDSPTIRVSGPAWPAPDASTGAAQAATTTETAATPVTAPMTAPMPAASAEMTVAMTGAADGGDGLEEMGADATRMGASMLPVVEAPRECTVVASYLPDSSLRYSPMPIAGPGLVRTMRLVTGWVLSVALALGPVVWWASGGMGLNWHLSWVLVLAALGGLLAFELTGPTRTACRELFEVYRFRWRLRRVELGVERAVSQPGVALRYEVHIPARRDIVLDAVHVRLVFWENWQSTRRLRLLPFRLRTQSKRGHDLVRHEVSRVALMKGQHAVIRGSVVVPERRPTEHHRGKHKHLAYVNLTITMQTRGTTGKVLQANCPRLVTFPWL